MLQCAQKFCFGQRLRNQFVRAIGDEVMDIFRQQERLGEVMIGSLAVVAAVAVGNGAGGYPPREMRLTVLSRCGRRCS